MSQAEIISDDSAVPSEADAPEDADFVEEDGADEEIGPDEGEEDEAEPAPKAKKPDPELAALKKELDSYKGMAHKERQQRQQEAERTRQLAAMVRRIEENVQKSKEPVQEPEIPNEEEDPLGAIKYLKSQLAQQAEERRQAAEHNARLEQMAQEVSGVGRWVENIEREYAEEHPDYFDASNHVIKFWKQQYEAAGYDPQTTNAEVIRHAMGFAQQAGRSGRNPAEAMYSLAKSCGYIPASERNKPSPLQAVKAGQAAAKTMSGGGRSAKGPLSFDQIAKIKDPEAFSKALDDYEKRMTGRA